MTALTRAHQELFRRVPDERFETFDALARHCQDQKDQSKDRWHPPTVLRAEPTASGRIALGAGSDGAFGLTDWSFGQLCSLAKVSKDTVIPFCPCL